VILHKAKVEHRPSYTLLSKAIDRAAQDLGTSHAIEREVFLLAQQDWVAVVERRTCSILGRRTAARLAALVVSSKPAVDVMSMLPRPGRDRLDTDVVTVGIGFLDERARRLIEPASVDAVYKQVERS
jgi:hypothetical protein